MISRGGSCVHSGENIKKFGLWMNRTVWSNFRIDLTAAFFISFFNIMLYQFFIPLAIINGASNVQVGIISAAPAIGLLLTPLWAAIIEKRHPMPYIFYPNLVAKILIVLPAFFPKGWIFVLTALLIFIIMNIQSPAYANLMTRTYPSELRGRLMSYARIAGSVMAVPLVFLIGHWIDQSGGRWPLVVAAITGVVNIFIFVRIKCTEHHTPNLEDKPHSTIRDQLQLVKQNRELAIFLAATMLIGFGNLLASPLYPIIQVEKLELTIAQIGYTRIISSCFMIVSYFTMGWVIDRLSPKTALLFGFAGTIIVPVLYALFGNYPVILVASGFQGFSDAVWDLGVLAYLLRLIPERAAVVFGLYLLLFGIRGTIAPLVSTSLIQSVSLEMMLTAAALISFIGVIIFAFGKYLFVSSKS